jgi:hypothetical protein
MVEPREKMRPVHPPPPSLPRAKPELRTEDLPVVVPSPGLSPRENSRPESGWVAFASPTEVEPLARTGDRRPDPLPSVSTLEPEPTYVRPLSLATEAHVPSATEKQAAPPAVRAPIAKLADAPSARRGPGPGVRLKEIVRPAPFDPDVPDTPVRPPAPEGERPPPGRAQGTPGARSVPARATPTGPKNPGFTSDPPAVGSEPQAPGLGPVAVTPGVSPTGPTIPPPSGRPSSWTPLILTVLAALLFGVILGHFLARASGAGGGSPAPATPELPRQVSPP